MTLLIVVVILSYILGSISFSLLIGKWVYGIDIRQQGSGNAGATNTLRILGKGPALGVLLLDVSKGIIAVWMGKYMLPTSALGMVLSGIAAIIGHNWPVFFRFRGGKGIATTIGVFAVLAFWPALYAGVIAIACIAWKRYVSLGSLLFAGLTPIFILLFRYDWKILLCSLLLFLFAVYRHRANISKLVQGTEHQIGCHKGEV